MQDVYNPDRIEKISKIMPQFNKVARAGDEVLLGLEGDPAFPFKASNRPTATIERVNHTEAGTEVTLKMADGSTRHVSEYSIAPNEVWEYSDAAFASVMERERKANGDRMSASRAEQAISEPAFRGDNHLKREVAQLRAELQAERDLTQNFHNTYIASLHELAQDVCKLDTTGKHANFCRTFNSEYRKMQSRAEEGVYRGTYGEDNEAAKDFSESDADSLSEVEQMPMTESDFF